VTRNLVLIFVGFLAIALLGWGTVAFFTKHAFLMRALPFFAVVSAISLMYIWMKIFHKERKD